MLIQCWASVADDGPTLYQHWMNVSCLLAKSRSRPHDLSIVSSNFVYDVVMTSFKNNYDNGLNSVSTEPRSLINTIKTL